MASYSLEWEELVWVLRLQGRKGRVQAFRTREDGVRWAAGLAQTDTEGLVLTIGRVGNGPLRVYRFPPGKK